MRSNSKYLALLALTPLLAPIKAYAMCPICTVAVGAGVGLSRKLGVDDGVTGLWIGALSVSMTLWTFTWYEKKKIRFVGMKLITIIGYYAMILGSLWYLKMLNHPANRLWGVDKLYLGITIGSIVFLLSSIAYLSVKEKNGGRAHFPFEKIVFVVLPLVILSFVFYFITK